MILLFLENFRFFGQTFWPRTLETEIVMPPIKRKRRNGNTNPKKKVIPVSTVNILSLNDDCLLDIFCYLSPLDMCAVKDTCHRFRGLAEHRMEQFYKKIEFVLGNRTRTDNSRQIKIFLKFCAVLSKLSISIGRLQSSEDGHIYSNLRHHDDKIIYATIRKCNPKLESLTLTDSDFELARCRLGSIFRNLRKLKLEYLNYEYRCDIRREDTISDLLKSCTSIQELSFGGKVSSLGSCYQGIFLQRKFKHLRALELYEVRQLDLNNLKLFLRYNPAVKNLALNCCVRSEELRDFNLVRHARHIEGLSIKFNESDHVTYRNRQLHWINDLYRMDNLKYLSVDTCGSDITTFVRNMAKRNQLIHLSLTNLLFKINEGLATSFHNMTNLKVLRLQISFYVDDNNSSLFLQTLCTNLVNLEELWFDSQTTTENVSEIVRRTANLKRLYLPYCRTLPEDSYLDIVDMQRTKKTDFTLTIFLESSISYRNVIRCIPSNVLHMNKSVINIANYIPSGTDAYELPLAKKNDVK